MPRCTLAPPLTDEDRIPWLESLHQQIVQWHDRNVNAVLTCSALKQKYRDILNGGLPEGTVNFVVLQASKAVLEERVSHRPGHFMSPALLDSQLATFEDPRDACISRLSILRKSGKADSGRFGTEFRRLEVLKPSRGTKAVQASRYFRTWWK